ncbi:MAG: DEAD/DEAH box helicase [Rickettsiales bacterium]|jgi:SNF2 family DNA or RNA helicase|nr:DEAD/DEAH box helicase [Rickettsiales bacterium]
MQIIHGFWSPETSQDFFKAGSFYIWVETSNVKKGEILKSSHPNQASKSELVNFCNKIGIRNISGDIKHIIESNQLTFPSVKNIPLLSPQIKQYPDLDKNITWQNFNVNCFKIDRPLIFLKEINFLSLYFPLNIKLGIDLKFWIKYSRVITKEIKQDHYIPGLKHQKKNNEIKIYPSWEFISQSMQSSIAQYAKAMPSICIAAAPSAGEQNNIQAYDSESSLKQFAEIMLNTMIKETKFTNKILKEAEDSFIEDNLNLLGDAIKIENPEEVLEQWHEWQENIKHEDSAIPFYLCFKLREASKLNPEDWSIEMLIESKKDPSFKISLSDYWHKLKDDKKLEQYFGLEIVKNILILLGQATRVFPKLLSALDTDKPSIIELSLEEAFFFLKEEAAILKNAGYKVIVPAWWSAKGQSRIKINLKAKSQKSSPSNDSDGLFSQDSILSFKYQLAMDGTSVSQEEFENLVSAKQSLVNFRGEWIEVNEDHMSEMLDLINVDKDQDHEMGYLELLRNISVNNNDFEYSFDEELGSNIKNLLNPNKFAILETPETFNGELREYQKRGFSWLSYLEKLGLNPCLADDMGLGKTIQIISLLAHDKVSKKEITTLLIVPTSVLGNWQKEIKKFAPNLKSFIHHGNDRIKVKKEFIKTVKEHNVVITSFALIRKDHKILKECKWYRIVVDEAQNIKNPQSLQYKSILSLSADHKIALTGTPIENRILDLWSIMNFLNPTYLGSQAEFRKNYELPIQKDNDRKQSIILKKLVEPFILRREKTDKAIINDLPDKIEQKIFCNLTKEQASLYEATVKSVSETLEKSEAHQQQGLMLSTLLKLKQICNHPAQFLQDNSEFSIDRSHKLTRLLAMVEEVIENKESMLIFSQFKEVGHQLSKLIAEKMQINSYFIHGGVSAKKREEMIETFQSPETPPSIFILSLKAGGVGITLTKANHVFHFDRWWNPAVENQATDRAYRIGQKNKVMVHKFVTIGTLEEKIDIMIEKKQKLSDNILGSSESWLTNLDTSSFKKLIALSKTAILE